MTRLLDHLPAMYQDIKEFRELSRTATVEYDGLDTAFEQVENDQFVLTSSEPGIARREKEFEIIPDRSIEDLPFRKRRVLTRMQDNPPYVDEYLKDLLDSLLGKNMTQLEIDRLHLELEVLVHVESASFYMEVQKILERIVPLNVALTTSVLLIKEYLILKTRTYGFDVIYKRTNKFRTAPVDGMGREVEKGVLDGMVYDFPVKFPRTNQFTTASVAGFVAAESGFEVTSEAYSFPANYPVTGKMVARSD